MKYFLLLSVFFSAMISHGMTFSEMYKNALISERKGELFIAINEYENAYRIAPTSVMKEQIELKIARITEDYAIKTGLYEKFLKNNDKSRFYYLVCYELGTIYYLKNELSKAINIFSILASQAFGTPYFIKSNLFIASIYLNTNQPDSAIPVIHRVLETVEDYEETAECYFLAGKAFFQKNKLKEATEYFLICAGNFSDSYMGRGALLELVRLFSQSGDSASAEMYGGIIALKYPDSYEYNEAVKLITNVNKKDAVSASEELISFQLDEQKKTSLLDLIQSEMIETIDVKETVSGDKYFLNPGTYIQLGNFSDEVNAEEHLKKLKNRGVESLVIYRGIGKDSYFYKVLSGPFVDRKDANQKVIVLKDMNIDSFIMEISKNYE